MKTKKPAGEKLTIGMDLGDHHHHVCVLDASGEILAEEVIANTREVLTALTARYPGATMVMETGTHRPWVSRRVSALGHPTIVANPRKLRAAEAAHSSRFRRAKPSATARTRRCPSPPLRVLSLSKRLALPRPR
jgi:transposase